MHIPVPSRGGNPPLGVLLLSLSLAATPAAVAGTRTAKAPHVSVELVSDGQAPAPGRVSWVGVKFVLEPGWHIYWQNPGDSGSAPSVKWTLPAGMTAGLIQWPVPSRFEVDGGVNYGYEGTVILPVALSASGAAPAGAPLQAQVRWVVCRDICVAGRADLEIPAGSSGESSDTLSRWQRELANARGQVPKPLPSGWRALSRISPASVSVELVTGRREQPRAFFPMEPAQVDHAAKAEFSPTPAGATIELKKSDLMTGTPPVFRGVVVLGDGKGYLVEAPVR